MKILMINKYLYYKGGAETYALKVGKYLEEKGNEVEYFGMNNKENIVGNSLKLYTREMDFHTSKLQKYLYPFKIIYSLEAKNKLKKILKDFKPDIIHMNNINFQLTPSIIEIAYKMNIPIIQTVHDYQMICPNHLLYNNKICERCINGSKWNCTKYNCIHKSKAKSIIGSIEAVLYTKVLKTYTKVSKYICPSKFLESKLLQASEIYKGKTVVMHNYIELKDETKKIKKDNYVLFFGRLSEEKGLDVFLDVCKKLPNIKFKIAGTGPLEKKCVNIKNVDFVGFKTGIELENLIAKAKFSVYPSVWYENCPLSILESESLGTPVITANYGGMKELVEDGLTGILVDKIDKENLKYAIETLYNDDKKIKNMSENCIEKRKRMTSMKQYCDKLLEIYEKEINYKKINFEKNIKNGENK